MFANSLVTLFKHGGPIMWPILVVAIVSLAIVGERLVWWIRESVRRDPARLEKVLAALENGDFAEAAKHSKGSEDPVVRMIWHGLNHVNASLQGALQVSAGAEIKRAGTVPDGDGYLYHRGSVARSVGNGHGHHGILQQGRG
jgi:biopolymer transport protein ExbB